MQTYLLVGPASVDGCGRITRRSPLFGGVGGSFSPHRRRLAPVVASAPVDGRQNHYAILGVSPSASAADIKKAYRLLALKVL